MPDEVKDRKRRRSEPAKVEVETPTLPEEPTVKEGRIVYEQDLRAAAHRNGHASDLLEPEDTTGIGGPPEPPEEDEPHHHDGRPERTRNVVLGLVYLGAGAVAIYIGIAMIRGTDKEKKAQ